MVLEDESGREYEATYISKRTGLSGGWRAFALDHKLDDGDALVFELYQPTSFKVSWAYPDFFFRLLVTAEKLHLWGGKYLGKSYRKYGFPYDYEVYRDILNFSLC